MDLRNHIRDEQLVERARKLVIRGLLNYQPWIFSDTLETGVGFEWVRQEFAGLVYFPDIDKRLLTSPELRRLLVDPVNYTEFHEANARLRQLYDGIVDQVCARLGEVRSLSFLDVGCNTGYIPQSFALRGAEQAGGCDREKGFGETIALLNDILGTRVNFHDVHFDLRTRDIKGVEPHDVVVSMAVLCHQPEPLSHIAAVGSLAKVAVLLWTLVNSDSGYSIHLGEPQGAYKDDRFPSCFDHDTTLSESLIRRSLELMGFREIHSIPPSTAGLPAFAWHGAELRGFLGIR